VADIDIYGPTGLDVGKIDSPLECLVEEIFNDEEKFRILFKNTVH
jgi:hypothetical protein